ncbi:M18BP-like protein [Mya arenaria]|uniref:M18BP-like protein n=1 Tax=Mya arenaria TaxID=6604 RepID=A0ABY7FEB8_MYAAR|nr:M18BP-like protein [Mya arenaria]
MTGRHFNSRFDQLVRESPMPQMYNHSMNASMFSNNGFDSLRSNPMSVSALPMVSSVRHQFDPFRSPQMLMRGQPTMENVSISTIFNSLKNPQPRNVGRHLEDEENNPNIHAGHTFGTKANSKKSTNNAVFNAIRNTNRNTILMPGRSSTQTYTQVLECNQQRQQRHGTLGNPTEELIGDEDMDSLDNMSYSEESITTADCVNEDLTSAASEVEACALFNWIIKVVPGMHSICVEGKKNLSDVNYWHSGMVVKRLGEKVVATHSGAVYRLVGNIDVMDALSAGFPKRVVEAFWVGFPEDWERVIAAYFNNEYLNRSAEETGSDDDIATLEETDVTKETTLDQHDIEVTEVEDSDDGNDEAKKGKNNPKQKKQRRSSTVRKVKSRAAVRPKVREKEKEDVLESWTIKVMPSGQGIQILGTRSNGRVWHSTAIEERLDRNRLKSSSGSVYKLKGHMDKLLAIDTVVTPTGMSVDVETLGRSRSGRLVKPPLQWWAGQQLVREGETFRVVVPTLGSSQYVQQFEDNFRNCKMRGQGGSKKKKNDSLNTSQSSVNTTQSSGIVDGNQGGKRGSSSRSVKDGQGCKEKISQNDLEVRIIFKQKTQQHEVSDKNSHKNTGGGKNCGSASEMYELDGSVDGGRTRNRRSASRKGSKVVKEVVDQDNVVSSSTNEQNMDCDSSVEMENGKRKAREIITKRASLSRTRNGQQVLEENQSSMSDRTLRSRNSVHEVDSDSEGDSTLEKAEVKTKQPEKRNTSSRSLREEVLTKTSLRNRKKMPVIIESDSDTSIDMESREQEERRKPGKKLEQGSSKGKKRKGGVRISENVVEEEEVDMEVRWTEEETNKLEDACKINNPAHPMYWLRVAEAVGTKTAEECSERFFRDSHTARTRSEKKKPVKEKPKVTSLTANKGTLKRKQQLRDMLDQGNQDYEDDLFESTPFKAKKRKAATFGLDDEDDEAIYEELARKQGKSRFETPKGDFSVGYIKPMAASSKKTPLSRVDEDMFTQKRDLDGYVHRIMKRRMVNKKKKVAVVVQDDADPRIIQKLFKDIMKETNTDKENHEDSEHEEDYYWDENIAENSS